MEKLRKLEGRGKLSGLYADSRGTANPTTDDQLCTPISGSINLLAPRHRGRWRRDAHSRGFTPRIRVDPRFLLLAPPIVLYCGFLVGTGIEMALSFPDIASALSRCNVKVNPIDPSRTLGIRNLASMFGVFTLMLTVSGLLLMTPLLYVVSHYYSVWQLKIIIGVWLCLWTLVVYFFSVPQYFSFR